MGSFNETCGISQLPISYGDKVRVFILADTSKLHYRQGNGGYCNSDDRWTPYGLSFVGKYNDYGSVEKVKNTYTSKLLFNNIISNIDQNYNEEECCPLDLTDPNLGWTDIVDSISQEEIKMKNCTLGVMFVLEDIYQAMISMNKIIVCRDKGGWAYEKLNNFLDLDMGNYLNKIKDDVARKRDLEEKIAKLEKEGNSTAIEILELKIKVDQALEEMIDDYSSIIESTINNYKSRHFLLYKKALMDLIGSGKYLNDKNIQLICSQLKEHVQFCQSLDSLRKGWMPQFGKGSQDCNYEAHLILTSAINNFCNKKNKEYDEEGGIYSEYEFSKSQLEHNEKEMKRRKLLAFT